MKLSVIVPVYNVEKYLSRCLDSLLRQGMEPGEWEVICVNDGSPDNCAAILTEYEQKYPNIFKVITQENQGLGEARNTGMKVAQGEYIGFVDSDDYVVNGGYAYLCDHFLKEKPDVLTFSARRVKSCDIDPLENVVPNGRVTFEGDGAEAYMRVHYRTVWSKLYKRLFLMEHDIWFEKILSQDQIFNFHVFRHLPLVVMTNCDVYRYMQDNAESIQQTKEKDKVRKLMDDQLYGMGVLNGFLSKSETPLSEGIKKSIDGYLGIFYTKSFYAKLSRKEWKHYMHPIQKMGINHILYEKGKTFMGKVVAMLKCASSQSYLIYLVVGFFHRNIFEKYILPKL